MKLKLFNIFLALILVNSLVGRFLFQTINAEDVNLPVIMINDNLALTNSDFVNVKFTTGSKPKAIRLLHCTVLNDCNLSNKNKEWGAWKTVQNTLENNGKFNSEQLDYLLEGNTDGEKTVCAQMSFIDTALSDSNAFCDSIVLDKTAPIGGIIINEGATDASSNIVNLKLWVSNYHQPIEDSTDPSDQGGNKVAVCHIPPGNSGAKHSINVGEKAVKAHLDHGDTLGVCTDSSNNGGGIINDKISYRISTGNDWSEWTTFNDLNATISNFSLPVSSGEAKVFVQFKDTAGNISEAYFDTINLSNIETTNLYNITYISGIAPTLSNNYDSYDFPASLEANATIVFHTKVGNKGDLLWYPQSSADPNPVNISYHWMYLGGNPNSDMVPGQYYQWEGSRANLNKIVTKGTLDSISISINTPTIAGNYQLQLDAVHEGITWFSQKGNPMQTFNVTIIYPYGYIDEPEVAGELQPYPYPEWGYGVNNITSQTSNLLESDYTMVCTTNIDAGTALYIYPDTTAYIIDYIPSGVNLSALSVGAGFIQVLLDSGQVGWVLTSTTKSNLDCPKPIYTLPAYILPNFINYRIAHVCNISVIDLKSYPSYQSSTLATIYLDTNIYLLDQLPASTGGNWIQVVIADTGTTGWIMDNFICGQPATGTTYNWNDEIVFTRPYETEECECSEETVQ